MRPLGAHRVAFVMARLPLLLLASTCAWAAGAPADRGNADRFPTVTVDVTPLDSNNLIVSDLKPADFAVKEDGKPVAQPRVMTLADVPRGEKPELNLMLVFDNSQSTSTQRMQAAADRFLARPQQQDRVAVVVGSTKYETVPVPLPDGTGDKLARAKLVQDFTSDWKLVRDAIDRIDMLGTTPLLDSLALAAREVMRLPQGSRAAIVVLTDGRDNYSLWSEDEAVKKVTQARRPVFLIGLSPWWLERTLHGGINERLLRDIAKPTGGVYFRAERDPNRARDAYDEILKRLNGTYRLTFESANLDARQLKRNYEVSLPERKLSFTLQLDIPAARAREQALLVAMPVLERQLAEARKHADAAEATAKQADEAHGKLADAIGRQSYGEAHASVGRLRPLGPAAEAEKANAEKIRPGEGCDPAVFASVSGEEKARNKAAEIEKEKARTAAAAARVADILTNPKKLPLEEAVLAVKPVLDRQAAELRRHADAAQAAVKQAEDALGRAFSAIEAKNYGEAFGAFERIRQAGPAVAAEERAAARFTLDEVPPAPFAAAKSDPMVAGVLKAIEQEKARLVKAAERAAELAQQAIVPELRAALGLMTQKPDDAALRQGYLARVETFIRDPAKVQPKKE
ncbi:MAG: VWA domain-containing protein, partial [Planctomycetes bacterium]|nr:VWA domain-containing protein [Planctomycetota bacterium]